MAAQVISLVQRLRPPPQRDWSPQEVAEFYRVESALLQAGLELESERGISDEGDPWFVFCRSDSGEVFIHFARVDGQYVVDGAALGATARGRDFTTLVRDLIGRHPLAATRRPGSNVFLHPAALLIALVGAAFFQSGHAKAAETDDGKAAAPEKAEGRRGLVVNAGGPAPAAGDGPRMVALDPSEVAAVLTGVAIGLRQATAAAGPAATSVHAAEADLLAGLVTPTPLRGVTLAASGGVRTTAFAQLSAAETRAALTVTAVVADLARSAMADAAQAAVSPVLSPAVLAPLATSATPGADASNAPPATLLPARPTLWVHLVEGPLPQIAAVRLVMSDPDLAKVMTSRAVQVESLPAILSDLIHKGEIVDLSHPAAPAAPPVDVGASTRPVETAPAPGHEHDTPATTPEPPSVLHSSDPQIPPVGGAPDPAPPVVPPPPTEPLTANEAITFFLAHVVGAAVMVSGREVVFYDPGLSEALQSGKLVETYTYKLEDGSSISLIGLSSDLHGLHGLG